MIYRARMGRQGGLTMIATVMILAFVGFIVLLAFKIVPIYIDYFNLRTAIESVKKDTGPEDSAADVRLKLERRWAIDYIAAVDFKDIKVKKQQGKLMLIADYEDRRPLMGNLDVVAKFNETVQLAP